MDCGQKGCTCLWGWLLDHGHSHRPPSLRHTAMRVKPLSVARLSAWHGLPWLSHQSMQRKRRRSYRSLPSALGLAWNSGHPLEPMGLIHSKCGLWGGHSPFTQGRSLTPGSHEANIRECLHFHELWAGRTNGFDRVRPPRRSASAHKVHTSF